MWHVSSCSGVATLRTAIHLLLPQFRHRKSIVLSTKLSTVELVDDTCNDRRLVAVYYTSANCNPITPSLRFVLDLLSNLQQLRQDVD